MSAGGTKAIVAWKSKGLSKESIIPLNTSGNSLTPKLKWIFNSNIRELLETKQTNIYS